MVLHKRGELNIKAGVGYEITPLWELCLSIERWIPGGGNAGTTKNDAYHKKLRGRKPHVVLGDNDTVTEIQWNGSDGGVPEHKIAESEFLFHNRKPLKVFKLDSDMMNCFKILILMAAGFDC